ncbi:hypothetical protein HYW75_04120 [Candidatus Pacearchaeota archaeon]|nr:hypothetical protein [Candidatus Pacearchaeota archaeon]
MTSTSKILISEICRILKSLNFKFRVNKRRSYIGKDGIKHQNSHNIRFDGSIQVNKWFKEIGSNSQKHITKYLVWKKFGFCPPRTRLTDRKKMLKNDLSPYTYYLQECQSGQMEHVKAVLA